MINIKNWCEKVCQSLNENKNKKYVLIAGASSSGKTYRCDVLKKYLTEKGKKCLLVSLDSYYKGVSMTIVEKAFLTKQFNEILDKKENLIKIVRSVTENSTFPNKFNAENEAKIKDELNKLLNKKTAEMFFNTMKREYENFNFDEPFAIDFKMIVDQISNKEQTFILPVYSFQVNERLKQQEKILNKNDFNVIIFEGIYGLREEILKNVNKNLITTTAVRCDLKTMLVRKLNRDIKQGRSSLTPQQTFISFFTQVMPSYFEYIEPSFKDADITLNSPLSYEEMIEKDQPTQIKLRYEPKDKKALKGTKLTRIEKQTDYYLIDNINKKQNITLRLREVDSKATELIINYDCPNKKGYEIYELTKMLEEKLCSINNIIKMFTSIGFKIQHKIEKVRNIFEKNDVHFTIDLVKNVGNFVEFDKKDTSKISKMFSNKKESDYSKLTYCEMLEQNEKTSFEKELNEKIK